MMQDQPSPDAILAAVAAWLRDTAAEALPAHARFEAKVAAGAVAAGAVAGTVAAGAVAHDADCAAAAAFFAARRALSLARRQSPKLA